MMIIGINRALLGWRALIGLIDIVSGVVQHVPIRPGGFDFDFLRKILFFSLAFPLTAGFKLSRPAHIILKPIDAEATLTDQAQDRGRHRVLIVENQQLLGAGLQSLLANKTDLDVIGISPGDCEELVWEIRRIQPDVVLLNADSHLADPAELLALPGNNPAVRVLAFNANNHLVRIYTKQEVFEILVERTPQLVNIICDR